MEMRLTGRCRRQTQEHKLTWRRQPNTLFQQTAGEGIVSLPCFFGAAWHHETPGERFSRESYPFVYPQEKRPLERVLRGEIPLTFLLLAFYVFVVTVLPFYCLFFS